MANILIDGYNLIGTAHGDLKKARNDLIDMLQKYSSLMNHQISLVFDGWKDGSKNETRSRSRNLTVIYSRLGENADSVIKKIVSKQAKSWIVISSDREVSDYAMSKDHAAVASHVFEHRLFKLLSRGDSESGNNIAHEDDEDYSSYSKKGNPRKLSKKDRRNLEALKKL